MAIDQLASAWESYRGAIDGFYEIAWPALEGERLLADNLIEPADAALEAVAVASEALGEVCQALLEGRSDRDHDEIAVLLLAAAALDTMLASDGLRLGPEELPPDERFTEGAGQAERETEPREEILAAADYLFDGFLGVGGAAGPANPGELRGACLDAVDTLVNTATQPALRFTFNALTLGADFAVTSAISQLSGVIGRAGLIRRHCVRLSADALHKIVGTVGEGAIDWVLGTVRDALQNVGAAILGRVAARADAESKIGELIGRPTPWSAVELGAVDSNVAGLTSAYIDQMKWTGTAAGWIARAAPLISTLAGPAIGVPVVSGVNAIGVGFVAYTLTIRVGSRSLPHPARVEGIVAIVGGRGSVPRAPRP